MKDLDLNAIHKLYLDKVPVTDIARIFGCCNHTIYRKLQVLGIKRDWTPGKIADIAGRRFGRLEALRYVRKDRFGKAVWLVRCDCGKEKEINSSGMLAGLVVSCGCYKHERNSRGYKDISGSWWRKLHKAAIRRGFVFQITMEDAWCVYEIQKRRCALSGVPIILHTDGGNRFQLQTASLDRIDSTKGYETGNIQWVHKRVNFLKRNYTDTELVYWSTKIAQYRFDLFTEMDPMTLVERKNPNENSVVVCNT